jgi:hypothetical protein
LDYVELWKTFVEINSKSPDPEAIREALARLACSILPDTPAESAQKCVVYFNSISDVEQQKSLFDDRVMEKRIVQQLCPYADFIVSVSTSTTTATVMRTRPWQP